MLRLCMMLWHSHLLSWLLSCSQELWHILCHVDRLVCKGLGWMHGLWLLGHSSLRSYGLRIFVARRPGL